MSASHICISSEEFQSGKWFSVSSRKSKLDKIASAKTCSNDNALELLVSYSIVFEMRPNFIKHLLAQPEKKKKGM